MAKPGQTQEYFLGIEATGRTVALLTDAEGEVLGEGVASSAVYSIVGQERSERNLWVAIIGAFEEAGFNTRDILGAEQVLPDVRAVCVGMSGVERPKDEGQVRRLLAKFNLFDKIIVTSDAHIVLEAASLAGQDENRPGYGVSILGGENGLAFAKGYDGRTVRAGGWGYLLGDEGSAHYIGLQAVRAVLQAADGRTDPTTLTAAVEKEWKLAENRPDTLSQRVYSLLASLGTGGNKAQLEESTEGYKRALAALAPLVERAAANGDGVAGAILDDVAAELAVSVEAVINRSGLNVARPATFKLGGLSFELTTGTTVPAAKIPLAIYGSVLMSNQGELRRRLQEQLPQCDAPLAVLNPAEGAVKLARLAASSEAPLE